jgi:chromate transporter
VISGPFAILFIFLRLGLTSFGGPVAHLGYFRAEFIARRQWLTDASYADLVGLCQLLPGPASSQVAIGIGLRQAGLAGAIAAWIGFTAPSATIMILAGYGIADFGGAAAEPWLHGLRVVAVAVVALAVWTMARSLAPDRMRGSIALAGAALALSIPNGIGQVAAIAMGFVVGRIMPPPQTTTAAPAATIERGERRTAIAALALFFILLFGLPALAAATNSDPILRLIDIFYHSGALVFGGGHVVLPLLRAALVPAGFLDDGSFLAGYGLVQAMPGPLFSFAAYLGVIARPAPHDWIGGLIALVAIYLPSFLLVIGALPFWSALRGNRATQAALRGINAAVVGLLLAALYDPVWTSTIHTRADFILAVGALVMLAWWKAPPWLVVTGGAIAGFALDRAAAFLG